MPVRYYRVYRDGGGGLALSVYIRHFHLQLVVKWTHIYIIVTTIGLKNGFFLTMGKVSNSKKAFF